MRVVSDNFSGWRIFINNRGLIQSVISIYNTLTRKIGPFKPIKKNQAGIYTCGPTVYNKVHIGNLRAFMFYDLFKRYLEYKGLKVKHVMNITDVDDKTIKKSQQEGKSLKEITGLYTNLFLTDCETLGWKKPDLMPRATEYIKEMIVFIKKLLEKGYAYKSEDNSIYFDVSKFKDYGKLSKTDLNKLKTGASGRVSQDEYTKEQAQDFALWKAWDKDDKDVYWETELGTGRPGWHIECSVMSSNLLGTPFDCHLGGVDLIFPHHENEIAQSESATGKRFVNYWIHIAPLLVDNRKMSKSLENFYTLDDMLKKDYKPKAVRYLLLATHYRQRLNFTFKALEGAKNSLSRMHEFMNKLEAVKKTLADRKEAAKAIKEVQIEFEKAMDNDFQISDSLKAIFEFIRKINKVFDKLGRKDAEVIKKQMLAFDKVLGFIQSDKETFPEEIEKLAKAREKARQQKKWSTADKIRNELSERGYEVKDTKEGFILRAQST